MDRNVKNGYGKNHGTILSNRDSCCDEVYRTSLDSSGGSLSETSTQSGNSSSPFSWTPLMVEAASAAVLLICCNDSYADLHKEKFVSGAKSKCVLLDNRWVTLPDFEYIAGINSKCWKRSIRFNGIRLQTLIEKGYLLPHASKCKCHLCCEGKTPRRRRRESQDSSPIYVQPKSKRFNSTRKSAATSIPISTIVDAYSSVTEVLTRIAQIPQPLDSQDKWKEVEDAAGDILTAANSVKTLVQEMKEGASHRPQQDFVRAEPVADCPEAFRAFTDHQEQFQTQEHSSQILGPESCEAPEESYSYEPEPPVYKCPRCGQDGFLECTGCHVVHYCSVDCQQKDRSCHQIGCTGRLLRQILLYSNGV